MSRPNRYIFDDPQTDQHRLLLQAELAREYLRDHAPRFLPTPPATILDLGSGNGYLSRLLHALYPQATLVGIDRNPLAVAAAQAQSGLDPRIQFVVGDIAQALPPGPFDLVYASAVLLHVPDLARVLDLVYAALAPGGTLWIKDIHQDFATASPDPNYQYLMQAALAAVHQLGGHPQLAVELPPLIAAAGFTALRVETDEVYPLGGDTIEGETGLTDAIALFYNARTMVSRVTGIAEDEILRRCDALIATAEASPQPLGVAPLINILARRPAVAE
jgi:SAM-dependent methyltransferase